MSEAMNKHPDADVMINFASLRSAYDATLEAMQFPQVSSTSTQFYCFKKKKDYVRFLLSLCCHLQIRTIAIIAEGIPEAKTRQLNRKAKEFGVTIIGPATVSTKKNILLSFLNLRKTYLRAVGAKSLS